jgi:microcompartment protein CcmK/EutM
MLLLLLLLLRLLWTARFTAAAAVATASNTAAGDGAVVLVNLTIGSAARASRSIRTISITDQTCSVKNMSKHALAATASCSALT